MAKDDDLAREHREEERYQADRRSFMQSSDGYAAARTSALALCDAIREQAVAIAAQKPVANLRVTIGAMAVGIATDELAMVARFTGTRPGAEWPAMTVELTKGPTALPGEPSPVLFPETTRISRTVYKPDIDRSRAVVWKAADAALGATDLARHLLEDFLTRAPTKR